MFSGCGRLEVIDISGSKAAVDVGRSRTSSGRRVLAAACAATALMSVGATAACARAPRRLRRHPRAASDGGGTPPPPVNDHAPSQPPLRPGGQPGPGTRSAPARRHQGAGPDHARLVEPGRVRPRALVVRRGWAGACPTSPRDRRPRSAEPRCAAARSTRTSLTRLTTAMPSSPSTGTGTTPGRRTAA